MQQAERPVRLRAPDLRSITTVRVTFRELEVLQLIADGCGNREIARGLNLSEETIKTHVRHLLARLGASSRANAVAIAFRAGLIR
jgi:DNA-binding NarL/FixJ family response regulator